MHIDITSSQSDFHPEVTLQEMQNRCCCAAIGYLFSVHLSETSFLRFPENKKPDDISSGFASLAVRTGLEPATLGVTGRYSNQLNYRTNCQLRCKNNPFFYSSK
jgi:hypothetical protein